MIITPNTGTFVNVATLVIDDNTVTADRWNLLRAMDVSGTTKKMAFMLYHNPIVLTGNDIYKFTDPATGQYIGADYQPVTEYSGYVYKFFIYPILCLNEALYRGALSAEHVNELLKPLHLTTDDLYNISSPGVNQPSMDDYVAYWNGIRGITPAGEDRIPLVTGIDPDYVDPQRKNIIDDETLGKTPETEQLFSGLYSLLSFQLASPNKWAYEAYPSQIGGVPSKSWYQTNWENNNVRIDIRMYVLEDKNASNMCPKPFEGYFTPSSGRDITASYEYSGFNLILVGVEQKPEPEPEPPTT